MKNQKIHCQIGQRLRKERENRGLTQEKFAELIGVSENYYGKIERGERCLSIELALIIYDKFSINLDYLLTGNGQKEFDLERILGEYPVEKRNILKSIITNIIEFSNYGD